MSKPSTSAAFVNAGPISRSLHAPNMRVGLNGPAAIVLHHLFHPQHQRPVPAAAACGRKACEVVGVQPSIRCKNAGHKILDDRRVH